jgi:hypothetical protein
MLYLIRSFGRNNKSALKVGFTDEIKNRVSTYKYHNPFSELISTREGSLLDETRVHTYLRSLRYKLDLLDEWFINCDKVNQLFHKSFETMNKVIWENRNNLFRKDDFLKENIMNELYQELNLLQSPLKELTSIDLEWKNVINKKYISQYKKNNDIDFL